METSTCTKTTLDRYFPALLHVQAKAEFEQSRLREAEQARQDEVRRIESLRRCNDSAFRERYPNTCRFEFILPTIPQYRSADDAYEYLLMGLCRLVATRAQATEYGCLPRH